MHLLWAILFEAAPVATPFWGYGQKVTGLTH